MADVYIGFAGLALLLLLQFTATQIKLTKLEKMMATQGQGLTGVQGSLDKLETSNAKLVTDVATLLANQQPGPQPGQVIVNQSDIDAVQARIDALTTADTTADGTVNPPAPPATT